MPRFQSVDSSITKQTLQPGCKMTAGAYLGNNGTRAVQGLDVALIWMLCFLALVCDVPDGMLCPSHSLVGSKLAVIMQRHQP